MKIKQKILFILLIFLVVLLGAVFALLKVNQEKIVWGVKAGECQIGRHSIQEAEKILEQKSRDFLEKEITLTLSLPSNFSAGNLSPSARTEQNYSFSVKPADLGIIIDCPSTAEQAYQIGRNVGLLKNIYEQICSSFGLRRIGLILRIDREKFQNKTAELFKEIESPAQNAVFVFDEKIDDFVFQPAREGLIIDRERLLKEIGQGVKILSSQSIELNAITLSPMLDKIENDSELLNQVQKILASQPFELTGESKVWSVNKKTLTDWMKFEIIKNEKTNEYQTTLVLDDGQIRNFLKKISAEINRPAIDAELKIENNRAIVFTLPAVGKEVQTEETLKKLKENILGEPPVRTTEISINQTAQPKTILKQTNNLGIESLIGQGVSSFRGSPKNRIHNIKTAVNKINGIIIAPNDEFSFNAAVGKTGPDEGFLEELVIKKDEIIPEYGGGVCQVSTTVFRAAVNAGLKVTFRRPHAIPITYYNPAGFDATVYDPWPDLKFVNNTANYLLFYGGIEGSQLTFNFYGTNDGRQVEIAGPIVLEKKEDGSMKTVLSQKVRVNGEIIEEQDFYSTYQSPADFEKKE